MLEVEERGRLVEQRDLRLLRKRAREENSLALATGQFLDMACGEIAQVEVLERRGCDLQIVRALEAEGAKMRRASHQHDLHHGEAKRDRIFLPDRRDGARELAALDRIDPTAEEFDASRARLDRSAEHLQQRGLARAVRTDDREHLAGRDFDRHAMQHRHAGISRLNRARTHRDGHNESGLRPSRRSI